MRNTKKSTLIVLSFFAALIGFLNGCGKNDINPVNPLPVISFISSGIPSGNSVYLEKTSSSNDEITFAVQVKGGSDVFGASIWMTYDGSKIKYLSASSSGSYLGNDLVYVPPALKNNREGILIIGIDKRGSVGGTNGDGTLMTLVFKALTVQSNTDISFNPTNSQLKSPAGEITGTNWMGGSLSYN